MLFLALSASLASAQRTPELLEGSPEFMDCLNSPDCGADFLGFLGEQMVTNGLSMQPMDTIGSPLTGLTRGVTIGLIADTAPFKQDPINPFGKVEQTAYAPMLPRVMLGYNNYLGTRGWEAGGAVYGAPPVPVKGGSTWLLGGSGSLSRPVSSTRLRLGGSVDGSYSQSRAPITASSSRVGQWTLTEEAYNDACPGGCEDTFVAVHGTVRAGVALDFDFLKPWLAGGVGYIWQRLSVDYDDTRWLVQGLQPTASVGLNAAIAERLEITVHGVGVFRSADVSQERAGLSVKIGTGLALRI